MIDNPIWHEWDEELQCNVFTSRTSVHPSYSQMYEDFSPGHATRTGSRPRAKYRSYWSAGSDFPMDYFVFYLEEDEKNFLEDYAEHIVESKEHHAKEWKRPKNPEGFSWCERCNVFHKKRDPNLPPLEEELAEIMAAEIAREIDEEIFQELMKLK